ncbi:MAG: hypothetical protein WC825_09315, partial [Gallionellaceae bacterium]
LLWLGMQHQPAPVSVAVPAVPAPVVANTPKVDTPVAFKSVPAYPKYVKSKLGLPVPVQVNDNKQVLEAVQIPADDHSQTVTCLQDTQSGQTDVYVSRNPAPLIAMDYSGNAGLYFGIKNGVQTLRVEARQGFVMVKEIHFGVLGSIDQPISTQMPPSGFVGGGIWGNWR